MKVEIQTDKDKIQAPEDSLGTNHIYISVPEMYSMICIKVGQDGTILVYRSVIGQHPNQILYQDFIDKDAISGNRLWAKNSS